MRLIPIAALLAACASTPSYKVDAFYHAAPCESILREWPNERCSPGAHRPVIVIPDAALTCVLLDLAPVCIRED